MVKESLGDMLREPFHNTKSEIRSVVYNVFEQVLLGLPRKYVIGEKLNTHIAKFVDIHADVEGLSKTLIASSSLWRLLQFLAGQNEYSS